MHPKIPGLALFIPSVLLLTAAGLVAAAGEGGPAFRFADVSDESLGLWEGAQPVLVYNHGIIRHADVADASEHSCYVHPLYGLDGEVLTDDFPKDHVHHRGLYWAWPFVTVGDKQYSLWETRGIRPEFRRWLARTTDGTTAELGIENAWIVEGGRAVMREELRLRVHRATPEGRAIDIVATWTPVEQPITLRGATDKGYGGLTLRFGPNTETVLTMPEGRAKEDVVMTRHAWTDFTGTFAGAKGRSGATIFVHPQHPDFPIQWVNRHYGMVSAGWPGTTARTLAAGESITCRYRVWIHRGAPDVVEIQRAYEDYIGTVKN